MNHIKLGEEETQVYLITVRLVHSPYVIFSLVLLHPLIKVVNTDNSFDTRERRALVHPTGPYATCVSVRIGPTGSVPLLLRQTVVDNQQPSG